MKRILCLALLGLVLASCGFPHTDPGPRPEPEPQVHIEICPPYCGP